MGRRKSDCKNEERSNSQACLPLGAAEAKEATPVSQNPLSLQSPGQFLTAVLSNEPLVALAEPFGCVTDPTATAVRDTWPEKHQDAQQQD